MMLPLDPPLSRGARPGLSNPDRPVDDLALAAYELDPDDPAVRVGFARCVLDADPENIWAMMVLARHAESAVEGAALMREAVRIGQRLWAAELDGRAPAPDWGTDGDAASFLAAVQAYGVMLVEDGHRGEAAQCLRFLLQLDPEDRLGAVRAMAEVGLVAPGTGGPAPR